MTAAAVVAVVVVCQAGIGRHHHPCDNGACGRVCQKHDPVVLQVHLQLGDQRGGRRPRRRRPKAAGEWLPAHLARGVVFLVYPVLDARAVRPLQAGIEIIRRARVQVAQGRWILRSPPCYQCSCTGS